MPSTLRWDFAQKSGQNRPLGEGSRRRRGRFTPRWFALGLGLITALASGALAGFNGTDPVTPETQRLSLSLPLAPSLPEAIPSKAAPEPANEVKPDLSPINPSQKEPNNEAEEAGPDWRSHTLESGETLSQLGRRIGLGSETALAMARSASEVYPVRRLRPGHTIKVRRTEDGNLAAARYRIDDHRYLAWEQNGEDGYSAQIETLPRTVRVKEAYARIRSSLFEAGAEAGLSERTTMELARIFGWDIDFAHDLRAGDWFRVLYEEVYRQGEKVGEGEILAAEFVVRGESHRAIRFTDTDGRTDYYHPDGRSVRKAFLRSPVKYTRITSRFSKNRQHPVLDRRRAHKGVDYGAPTGTPVRATGSGQVTFRGWKGGFGRVVMIRHANRFTTVYAHLSRFASAHKGQRVEQGQPIGYVGQSGLATGPHLHYEFRIRGTHRNPLTVDFPKAKALPEKHRPAFERRRHHLTAWMETVGPQSLRVARAGDDRAS